VREEYADTVIERQVQRLKAVIDLGRNIREKHNLRVKVRFRSARKYVCWKLSEHQMPLKELVVFHHDQEYLDDVKSLESYIAAELNVVNVVYTSDESAVGIKYKASADWPTLGKRLRKDIGKVKNALPSLSSDECKGFVLNGKMNVSGVELVTGDLVVTRFVESPSTTGSTSEITHENATDKDVIVILDIRKHADLESLTMLRSLTSRINKLRKECGLKQTDKVDIFYEYDEGQTDLLAETISANQEALVNPFGVLPGPKSQLSQGTKVIGVEKRAKGADDTDPEERYIITLAESA
jgi:isoleucyl-tRNA synthetase